MKKIPFILSLYLLSPFSSLLLAHQTDNSYTGIDITSEKIQIILTFDVTDLANNFDLDSNSNDVLEREELLDGMPEMYDYLTENFSLAIGYTPVEMEQQEGGFEQDEFGNVFINFVFTKTVSEPPAEIGFSLDIFEKFGSRHKNLCRVGFDGENQQAIFTIDQSRKRFVVEGEISLLSQLWQFTVLGIEHIFLGYDHIMFLIGLIAIGGRFISLVKIVTSFTIAHSITLILAALEVLSLPPRLIESGIALSIAYVAAENFLIISSKDKEESKRAADHRWILTFFFGLVHGFGFANVLRDLGLPTKGLVGSLLAFNVGVELGQVMIVAVVFPIVLWVSRIKTQRQFVYAVSSVIFIFGIGWFVERVFEVEFMPF